MDPVKDMESSTGVLEQEALDTQAVDSTLAEETTLQQVSNVTDSDKGIASEDMPAVAKTDVLAENKADDSASQDTTGGEPAAPNISSYFDNMLDDNPFNRIADGEKGSDATSAITEGAKVNSPALETDLRLQGEDEERMYSPPISKEEMISDLFGIQSVSVDTRKADPQEIDRMYDAWIPTDATRHFLMRSIASGGIAQVPADKLLRPRLAMADTQADPVYLETFKLRGEREVLKRKHILDLSHVEHTVAGLHKLIVAECWRSALDLTAIILTNMGQGLQPLSTSAECVITPESMKVWAVRMALLTKLRLYSIAEAECQQFAHMDSPQLHFELYSELYPGRTGSMVPFSLRLLYACLPQFLGRHNESLDRLFYVRGQVSKILHNLKSGRSEDGGATVLSSASSAASMTLWQQRELRVIYSLAACLSDMKDFRLALSVYKDLLVKDPENVHFTYSTMARLCLQMGALKAAESYFVMSASSCKDDSMKEKLTALHSGYMSMCEGRYKTSPSSFSTASDQETLHSFAKNNAAVSMLYSGQLKTGVLLLEELIMSDPAKYLQDLTATNLCTLYELESNISTAKKQSLLFLANQHKGNGFNVNCLKMAL